MKFVEFEKIYKERGMTGIDFPVYVLLGDDYFLNRQVIKHIESAFLGDFKDMNLHVASADESVSDALSVADMMPFMDEYRVVEIAPATLSDGDKAALKAYISSPPNSTKLVISSDSPKLNVGSENAAYIDCSALQGADLEDFIKDIARSLNAVIAPDAIRALIALTSNQTSKIYNEIKKLADYSDGRIDAAAVRLLVADTVENQIYLMSDAISKQDAPRAYKVLNSLFKQGIKSITIINNLYERYRKLLFVSLNKNEAAADIMRFLGIRKEGELYHLRMAANNYSQVQLKRSVDYLHDAQCSVLSGRLGDETALNMAIGRLLTSN